MTVSTLADLEGAALAYHGIRLDPDMKTVVFPDTMAQTTGEPGSSCTRCALWMYRSTRPTTVTAEGTPVTGSKIMDVSCLTCGRTSRVTVRKAHALSVHSQRLAARKI